MPELMQWEQDIIINSMSRKSSAELSQLLGIDEKLIADFICASRGSIETQDQKIAERKIIREKNRPAKKKKVKEKKNVVTSAMITHPSYKIVERKYKTRQLNMHDLIRVAIDHKTWAYVKPGTDIEKTKQFYITLMNNKLKPKN